MTTQTVTLRAVPISAPPTTEVIAGQALFTPLTLEELFRAVAVSAPGCEFGIAMAEGSSGVVRSAGNNRELREAVASEVLVVGAGHFFMIFARGLFSTQVITSIRDIQSVVNLVCATGNPVVLIAADTTDGTAVLGAVDGIRAERLERDEEVPGRRSFLRSLGYYE